MGDVIGNTVLSNSATRHCVDGLHLRHRRVYYCSVTAYNGGVVKKNVTVHSDGGKSNYDNYIICVYACEKTIVIMYVCKLLCVLECVFFYIEGPASNSACRE